MACDIELIAGKLAKDRLDMLLDYLFILRQQFAVKTLHSALAIFEEESMQSNVYSNYRLLAPVGTNRVDNLAKGNIKAAI